MFSLQQILSIVPVFLAVAHGQGVITKAQGTTGSVASTGMQVSLTQTDANIINKTEITDNIVNECGRTLLAGNIDIGQTTEDLLANKSVTSVTAGGTVTVTINQVSTAGAGPYTCDLDPTSNSQGSSGQTALNVTEVTSTSADITLVVTMPTNLKCTGASTGNVCTVRCFNSAATGPFGGCFAVQQTDTTATVNTVDNIKTSQALSAMLAQVIENQADLSVAVASNHEATDTTQQGVLNANALLKVNNLNKRARLTKRGRKERRYIS